jgi:hypothetical protein
VVPVEMAANRLSSMSNFSTEEFVVAVPLYARRDLGESTDLDSVAMLKFWLLITWISIPRFLSNNPDDGTLFVVTNNYATRTHWNNAVPRMMKKMSAKVSCYRVSRLQGL